MSISPAESGRAMPVERVARSSVLPARAFRMDADWLCRMAQLARDDETEARICPSSERTPAR